MRLFPLFLLALFASFAAQHEKILLATTVSVSKTPEPPKIKNNRVKAKKKSVEEQLKVYFYSREVRPSIIVNNLDSGIYREKGEEAIDIGKHKIVWFYARGETKIKIDDDIFSLEGRKTLNLVDEGKTGDVDFANVWDQIKLFEYGGRELIGISIINVPCTGIGCRVAMYLIYDLKTKTKNFFGTYRFLLDREFGLYDFKNAGSLDFLSGTYDDGNDGKGIEFQNIYEIFTMDKAGNFHPHLDGKGKPYFMRRFYKEEDYEEIDSKFRQNWIEEIR